MTNRTEWNCSIWQRKSWKSRKKNRNNRNYKNWRRKA